MSIYQFPSIWIAIVLAGIAGCVATALVANMTKGVPFSAVAGNWAKHAWSILFFVPVPLLLGLPLGLLIAFAWLVLVPTIASKTHFGPKDLPHMTLNMFHAGYAVVGLLVYFAVTTLMYTAQLPVSGL